MDELGYELQMRACLAEDQGVKGQRVLETTAGHLPRNLNKWDIEEMMAVGSSRSRGSNISNHNNSSSNNNGTSSSGSGNTTTR